MTSIKIINKSTNELPKYETRGAAGMDIRAFIKEDISILPFERVLVPTGLYIELPLGYEAQLRPRSGLSIKSGITLPNSPATIDSDYRGEIKVALINLSQEVFVLRSGDRMAQMIIAKHETAAWELVENIAESERSDKGFGSTGLQ
jgi:dUTP pyrophosphatase